MSLLRFCVFIALAACGGAGAPTGETNDEDVESGAGGASDPRCLPQGGYADDACDRCENDFCCEERFDCYDDTSCGAAADVLDACVDRAQCWSDFRASGPRARARFECARAHCASVCAVPS